jgi:hypothetical protein
MGHTATATITATALVKDTISADLIATSGTAFTDASTLEVAYPREGKLLLVIKQTAADTKTVTLEGGEYHAGVLGDYTFNAGQNDVLYLYPSSDRFKDFDGMLNLTFGTGATGFVLAISLPY